MFSRQAGKPIGAGTMRKLRDLSGDFWRGLGATVVLPGIAALYVLGLVALALDEALFGGHWADQAADWTAGGALFLGLVTAYGYCCGYLVGRNDRG
jgi:hypothetical protein